MNMNEEIKKAASVASLITGLLMSAERAINFAQYLKDVFKDDLTDEEMKQVNDEFNATHILLQETE